MNKIIIFIFMVSVCSFSGFAQKLNALSEAEIGEGYQLLFNGKDLNGWAIHGTEKWVVENGILTASSGPDNGYGYLVTERNYKDFILKLEFRLEANGNSGVFFRSNLNGTDIKGWQVEVAPPGENTGGIYESGGRGWLFQIPDNKENILKVGEWNQLVIQLRGSQVMTWMNGEVMTDLSDDAIGAGTGKIALQVHSGGGVAVKWKNIFIKEM